VGKRVTGSRQVVLVRFRRYPFRTRVLENRAKKNGTAFLRRVTPAALPSPYDLTGDSAWLEDGDLLALYNLDLEGVNAPVSYDQTGTSVTTRKSSLH